MSIHWQSLAKTAAVLGCIVILRALRVDVPPTLLAMGATVVAGALPGWLRGAS